MIDTALNGQAKVVSVVGERDWNWPNVSSWEVREIIAHTPPELKPSFGCKDNTIWLSSKDGKFSIGSAWNVWRSKWPIV